MNDNALTFTTLITDQRKIIVAEPELGEMSTGTGRWQ